MASSESCFYCKEKTAEFIRGWQLKDGSFAELCETCGSAYVKGRFCKTFHRGIDGWRDCSLCRKPLHCGCIMSIHMYAELDFGGVGCTPCLLQIEKSIQSVSQGMTDLAESSSNSDTHYLLPNEKIAESFCPGSYSEANALALHFGENSNMDSSSGVEMEDDNKAGSETTRVDASVESHLQVQNLPKMTSLEQLQKFYRDGDSSYDAVHLFAKTLTSSDTDYRNARLVVPKKQAEEQSPLDKKRASRKTRLSMTGMDLGSRPLVSGRISSIIFAEAICKLRLIWCRSLPCTQKSLHITTCCFRD